MSSILKALQKVERELADGVQDPKSSGRFRIHGPGAERSGKFAAKGAFSAVMLGLILLVGVGVWLWVERPPWAGRWFLSEPESTPDIAVSTVKTPDETKKPDPASMRGSKPLEPEPLKALPPAPSEADTLTKVPVAEEDAAPPKISQPPLEAVSSKPLGPPENLALHAIAWSPEAKQRMAVVNDRIVREGGSIGGFSVLRIDPDRIVVRDSRGERNLNLRR